MSRATMNARARAARGAPWPPVCIGAVTGFLVLAVLAALTGPLPGDVALRDAVLAAASPALVTLARVINYGGEWPGLLPATVLLFALSSESRRRWWLWCGIMAGTGIAETAFKHLVARPRPEDVSMGFPSGHAAAIAVFSVILLYLAGRSRVAAERRIAFVSVTLVVVGLVGLARIVLNAHWPSD
ncbi:MAG TPA: phosphatase PAP2 family protein, partial [Candidatus Limnocylindrales bacterium]|nr:phosphatase PAP2 family protein [Candidatus Limnocylindrales bacterium]